jgi:hypothetical protein
MARNVVIGRTDLNFLQFSLGMVAAPNSAAPLLIEAKLLVRMEAFSGDLLVWIEKDELFQLLDGLVLLKQRPTESVAWKLRSRQVDLIFDGKPTGHIWVRGQLAQNPPSDGRTNAVLNCGFEMDQTFLDAPIEAMRSFIAGAF